MKKILIIALLAFFIASCSDNQEVTVYPIAPISGVEWCEYEIEQINDTSARLKTGEILCIPCIDGRTKCPDYTRFVWGAYDMKVKRVATYCTSCSSTNYFDVGAPL